MNAVQLQASRQTFHRIIAELIPRGSRVLDLGCGSGELLALLVASCEEPDLALQLARGIEIVDQFDGKVGFAAAHFQGHMMNRAALAEECGFQPGPGSCAGFWHCRERGRGEDRGGFCGLAALEQLVWGILAGQKVVDLSKAFGPAGHLDRETGALEA